MGRICICFCMGLLRQRVAPAAVPHSALGYAAPHPQSCEEARAAAVWAWEGGWTTVSLLAPLDELGGQEAGPGQGGAAAAGLGRWGAEGCLGRPASVAARRRRAG